MFSGYCCMGPSGRFYPYLYHCGYIRLLGTGFMQVFHLGRAPRTKETLPEFLKWRRVTRHPLVFRGLTGSQWTPGFWGVAELKLHRLLGHTLHPVSQLSLLISKGSHLRLVNSGSFDMVLVQTGLFG